MRALLTLALLLPLTACSGGDGGTPSAAPAPGTAAATSGAASSGPAGSGAPVAADAVLVLRADGLELRTGGETQQIPFGSPTGVVVPALAAALGEPEPLAVECGQGVRDTVGKDGFDVLFDEGKFVGWDESGAGLATAEGLKLGSSRADVQRALPGAEFSTATLGPEFSTPQGLGGFLDGEAPTSVLVGLYGGESCVVR